MKTELKEEKEKSLEDKEKERILTLLLSKAAPMASDYKHTVKQTGSWLAGSMALAYSKAIQDVIKLIAKEER